MAGTTTKTGVKSAGAKQVGRMILAFVIAMIIAYIIYVISTQLRMKMAAAVGAGV